MSNPAYTEEYKQKYVLGSEFQDFVADQLYEHGLPIVSYLSKRYQWRVGENRTGCEIKLDRYLHRTGQFFIEIAEKSKKENQHFVPSGICRDDNSWLYIIGDFQNIYILSKRLLREYYAQERDNLHYPKCATSRGFLVSVALAKELFLLHHIVPKIPPPPPLENAQQELEGFW